MHEGAAEWSDFRHLLLAVEVISPGSERNDGRWKRRHGRQANLAGF